MTLREVYQIGTEKLVAAGIEEASLDAWYLLEHVTGISRAGFLADSGKRMEEAEKETYLELIERRAMRIPLQHITGVQEFMGLEFQVNEHVLIPRQDTEILVETALKEMSRRFKNLRNLKEQRRTGTEESNVETQVQILDMCTGSGCILLSILYYARQEAEKCGFAVEEELQNQKTENDCAPDSIQKMRQNGSRIKITGVGVDVSEDALRVAAQNGHHLNMEAKWVESDLFDKIEETFDMILSNPPYIPSAVIETLQPEVRDHDPRLALDGKEDGLYFYRRIVEEGRRHLKNGGCLIFEIGSDQGEVVSSYMKECGYTQVTVEKDLAGLDRMVSGVYDICNVNGRKE